MITILVDHNIEGQALLLWRVLSVQGWLELFPIRLVMFPNVGLAYESTDREVWHFAQKNRMILLTANRSMRGEDSLEQTIREENTIASLPVFTIGNVDKMVERTYCEQCALRLLEVGLELEKYL